MQTTARKIDDAGRVDPDLALARSRATEGRDAAAQAAYLALLAREPTHFQGLTELAKLALAGGYRSAARTAYEQAVQHHPGEAVAHVNLANLLRADNEVEAAKRHYLSALGIDPDFAPAHQGLALILAEEGDEAGAARHRAAGFGGRHAVVRRPYRGLGTAPRVLLLVSARGGNIPTDGWLDDRHYDVTALFAEFFAATDLPPHDLIVNAIGDADLCQDALAHAIAICARTVRPVLNPPDRILPTARADTARHLGGIADVVMPAARLLTPAAIQAIDDMTYPVLLRRPGFHTGQHFHRIEARDDLLATLNSFERAGAGDVLLIPYLDARGADGMARKYRVMFIDGELYPLHLAISADWKVHYFTSAMAENAAYRGEEQRFLDDPSSVIGAAGMSALGHIAARLGLDYAGIDFALSRTGEILVFEANATMVLIPPGDDPRWDYRRPAIGRAFEAVTHMIGQRVATP